MFICLFAKTPQLLLYQNIFFTPFVCLLLDCWSQSASAPGLILAPTLPLSKINLDQVYQNQIWTTVREVRKSEEISYNGSTKKTFFHFGNFWWLLVHFTPVPFLFKPGVFAYFLNMYIFLKSLGIFLMHCWGWGGVPQTRGGGTDMATGCFCAAGFGPGSPVVATALSMSHRCHLTVDLTHGLSCKMSSHSKCDNSGDTGWWPVPI